MTALPPPRRVCFGCTCALSAGRRATASQSDVVMVVGVVLVLAVCVVYTARASRFVSAAGNGGGGSDDGFDSGL